MTSRRLFIVCTLSLGLTAACWNANAAPPTRACATALEKNALDIRVLQTELMVAALTCNEKMQYGQFVKKFQPQLKRQSTMLKSYFSRTYKGNGSVQMNRFVTQIANGAAERHAHTKPSIYCAGAKNLFTEALQQTDTSLLHISAQERFTSQHGVLQCETKKSTKPTVKMVQK